MPAQTSGSRRLVHFGIFQVNLESGELFRNGVKVKLPQQPFQILANLLERPGEVVTREQLYQRIWPNGTFVDFEHGLNAAITKLRQALGDDAENPRFVETLARRGYRFIAPVDTGEPAEIAAAPARAHPRPPILLAVLSAVFIAAAAAIWHLERRPRPAWTEVPLTSYPGIEKDPTFSPDGSQVAFSWNGEKQDNYDIYVKVIGVEKPSRLTVHPGEDARPVWSPDGRWIAFTRELVFGQKSVLMLMPANGAYERQLSEGCGSYPGAWTPDSKWLVISERSTCEQPLALYLLSAETGERRRLTTPPADSPWGDTVAALSSDGHSLAFFRQVKLSRGELFALDLSSGLAPQREPRRLKSLEGDINRFVWTPDGRELLFTSDNRLWKMPASGAGAPQVLPASGIWSIAISTKPDRLALVKVVWDSNLWRVNLPRPAPGAQVDAVPGDRFLRSTRSEYNPQFSPDGKRIAFCSSRSGHYAIWVSDAGGSNASELAFVGSFSGTPRWAPDSQRVAFDAQVDGQWDIYIVSEKGGKPVRLTGDLADDVCPSWSRDGRWVYFASRRGGKYQVWKVRPEGGEPVQMTRNGGHVAFESVDGKFVYYTKDDLADANLWKLPAEGGAEAEILPSIWERNFFVATRGIYFIPRPMPGQKYVLQFLDFATGKVKTIVRAQSQVATGLTVSPDERAVLYSALESAGADLVLVENFR